MWERFTSISASVVCFSGGPAITQADVDKSVEAAVDAAKEESEETLGDLLACLGQEERKTVRCAADQKLQEAERLSSHVAPRPARDREARLNGVISLVGNLQECVFRIRVL